MTWLPISDDLDDMTKALAYQTRGLARFADDDWALAIQDFNMALGLNSGLREARGHREQAQERLLRTAIEARAEAATSQGTASPAVSRDATREALKVWREASADRDAWRIYGMWPQAVLWQDWFVIGFSRSLVLIDVRDGRRKSIDLDRAGVGYFSDFCAAPDHLLVAAGGGVLRVSAEGDVAWRNGNLAVDGAFIERVEDGVVFGFGEWDPPDDMTLDFQISLDTGALLGPHTRRPPFGPSD
jgi:hypothetical protein